MIDESKIEIRKRRKKLHVIITLFTKMCTHLTVNLHRKKKQMYYFFIVIANKWLFGHSVIKSVHNMRGGPSLCLFAITCVLLLSVVMMVVVFCFRHLLLHLTVAERNTNGTVSTKWTHCALHAALEIRIEKKRCVKLQSNNGKSSVRLNGSYTHTNTWKECGEKKNAIHKL